MADDSAVTHVVVERYHRAWKALDVDAVMALYHPEVRYHDFHGRSLITLCGLRDYVLDSLPSGANESLAHTDRIRVDGDCAFLQYCYTVKSRMVRGRLTRFHGSEVIRVQDGLIIEVKEYCVVAGNSAAQGAGRIGLSPLRLTRLVADLEDYFSRHRPYLDPDLNLAAVATASGYTRNQISHALNHVLGVSFYTYLARARIAHLLALPANARPASAMDMALYAGFSSISTFYKAFRQATGTTVQRYFAAADFERSRTHDKT
ncbi:helix-turn-helix domain-containing protein [Craterilacuibacter sinensis]|uniref:Helix-turn-helix domain-containing protein n=1 Tax=Craterilacuibacter sinensis TaxID=2686017 RepID=A0A845BLZ7_9NEIS|nr:helix-turn-helix domain-containing protein [Craterilacuibacter sinensis]MXR37365.1 helix-turn-helix domain-containing protein [Craterilacuibacter sinensis]